MPHHRVVASTVRKNVLAFPLRNATVTAACVVIRRPYSPVSGRYSRTCTTYHSSWTSKRPFVSLPSIGVSGALNLQVQNGSLQADKAQARAAAKLERLHAALVGYDNREIISQYHNQNEEIVGDAETEGDHSTVESTASLATIGEVKAVEPQPRTRTRVPRGMYIHGEVGTGKSLLMDLFFTTAPLEKKQRYHFHEFLSTVHRRIHQLKKHDLVTRGRDFHVDTRLHRNPVYRVAAEFASEASLLCLDEFQVTDIADAMILSLLFSTLFSMGVVLVATSNRSPNELYEGGLNRSYFLPFIDILKRHCLIHDMGSSLDYRVFNASLDGSDAHYFPSFFLSDKSDGRLRDMVRILRQEEPGSPLELAVPFSSSRRVHVPSADESYRVGRFHFADLCDKALGASDYRAVATSFDCVAIDSIPILSKRRHNQARRFITLVDELYEAKTPIVCSAAAVPASKLFQSETERLEDEDDASASLASVRELSFAFRRAASRLEEMTSRAWWDRYYPDPEILSQASEGSIVGPHGFP